jgi:hypothetical protein
MQIPDHELRRRECQAGSDLRSAALVGRCSSLGEVWHLPQSRAQINPAVFCALRRLKRAAILSAVNLPRSHSAPRTAIGLPSSQTRTI